MSRRRPPRPWVGPVTPVDPADLPGPRGLTEEVLREDEGDAEVAPAPAAFYWLLLTAERKARIQSVVEARLQSVTVLLDRLLDPHNTAAILRTAEGLGLARVHVVAHEAADGIAHRHLDRAARLYSELPADRPMALLFGNEHEGPSPETLAACTGTFRIPMAGFTQSFNVSVAAGIALAHLASARRRLLGQPGDLSEEARVQLRDRFTLLAAKLARRMKPRP
ncbi:MAG: RNA methyltransferase [Deltaproteobacteria bacterium]|nr:MAG: RNA methyltransferase [Deltaproteobacteria bacterium]